MDFTPVHPGIGEQKNTWNHVRRSAPLPRSMARPETDSRLRCQKANAPIGLRFMAALIKERRYIEWQKIGKVLSAIYNISQLALLSSGTNILQIIYHSGPFFSSFRRMEIQCAKIAIRTPVGHNTSWKLSARKASSTNAGHDRAFRFRWWQHTW